ncbi:cobaltochelatase subunit CobN [Pseudomonas aeruginosa]|nr:cobaltochelatase subunit CobN [Pseudomonas aeruginosa]
MLARWGEPQQDPMFRDGRMMVAGLRYGLTPSASSRRAAISSIRRRSTTIPTWCRRTATWRSTWLRHAYRADALLHVGKHGNLEWRRARSRPVRRMLAGRVARSAAEHLSVHRQRSGEGAQAKRRTQAVIIDHLMPPLTRAESYGPLRDLERLADEFYDARCSTRAAPNSCAARFRPPARQPSRPRDRPVASATVRTAGCARAERLSLRP